MHRVDAPGHVANQYSDGNPAIGQQATQVRAAHLNDIQENICTVIEAAGIALSKGDADQLLQAIQGLNGAGSLLGIQVLTANGVYAPTEGTNAVEVTVIGGGGGGAGSAAMSGSQFAAGGGGGGGGLGVSVLTAGFDGAAVTIGAGGAGGVGAANGAAGGTSSFGALITATGGQGGHFGAASTVATVQAGGAGGTCADGNVLASNGDPGKPGIAFASGNLVSGAGGDGLMGTGGGNPVPGPTGPGQPGSARGSGGSGAVGQNSAAAQTGGAGAPGVIIIREYA